MNKFDIENVWEEYNKQRSFLQKVAKFYQHSLYEYEGVPEYVMGEKNWPKQRGIVEDIVKQFQIGYAGQSQDLLDFVAADGLDESLLYDTGIFVASEENDTVYDTFYNRVIFPLHDVAGSVIGFSGRIWQEGDNRAKFINSPTSTIFSKSFTLYGLNFCVEDIRQEGFAWVVEGVPDVIACFQSGVYNTVAPCGTYITKYHLQLLKSITNNVAFCFDNDPAGIKALNHAKEHCKELNLNHTSITLTGAKDPDEILHKHGGENEVRRVLQSPF